MTLGFWIGKLLRLQKLSNRLGRYAGHLVASASSDSPRKIGDGFHRLHHFILRRAAGLLGAVTDGLPPMESPSGYFWLLAVKAVMDGLAMTGFVKLFGWPSALSAFPVFAFLGGITSPASFTQNRFSQRTVWLTRSMPPADWSRAPLR